MVLVLQSRSGGGESSTNNWLTNTAYSMSTLRSNDLEKGRGKPSPSPVDCGWEFDTTRHHYAPVRCLNPPAPAAVMNLVKCGANVDARGHVAVGRTIFHARKCVPV